jgi:uncharacterized Zn finger protein (UPF0148 family)
MPEPEIARRCHSCGVSIREKAAFCPQCGKKQEAQPATDESVSIHDTEDVVRDYNQTLTETDFQKRKPVSGQKAANEPRKPTVARAARQKAVEEVGARIQRATTRARDVEGNVIHRVQKFREISSVVLDEAGYDPSLRFVLVAAALFLLFVLILLLNKLIG